MINLVKKIVIHILLIKLLISFGKYYILCISLFLYLMYFFIHQANAPRRVACAKDLLTCLRP